MSELTTEHRTSSRQYLGGPLHRYLFPNGYGASVVSHRGSYGHEDGLWELAVLDHDGHLCYDTPVTADVLGFLTEADVNEALDKIAALSEPVQSCR